MPATSAGRRRIGRASALLAATAAALTAALVATPAYAAPPTVSAINVTADSDATVGDIVTMAAVAASVDDLYAYELTVTFDPALLDFESATFPDGGFGSVGESGGTLTVSYTRLGTSPGLVGSDLLLASLEFTALSAGTATLDMSAATFVSSTTESTDATDLGVATAAISAAATPSPSPSVSATPTASATPAASATATAVPSADSTDPSDPLASTGTDGTVWLVAGAVGVALVALGVVLALRRKAVQR